jgi:hypothetical protein
MNLQPRHTKIVESISTPFGRLIREDYFDYPEAESNIYMIDEDGKPIWFAQRVMDDDKYANYIVLLDENTFRCASWNGFTSDINLENGTLISSEFTR